MKIIHEIRNDWTEKNEEELKKFEILVEAGKISGIRVEDKLYNKIKYIFEDQNVLYAYGTEFSKKEVESSKILVLNKVWTKGYPFPENEYKNLTYDLSNYCPKCGVGKKQIHPIKIKAEPKLGNRKLMRLIWLYDVLFAETEFFNSILQPIGIKNREVLIGNSDKKSTSIVQLILPITNNEMLNPEIEYTKCEVCNRVKYSPLVKGFFPGLSGEVNDDIFLSKEEFGSGALSYKRIFISQKMRKILNSNKISKYRDFIPVNIQN